MKCRSRRRSVPAFRRVRTVCCLHRTHRSRFSTHSLALLKLRLSVIRNPKCQQGKHFEHGRHSLTLRVLIELRSENPHSGRCLSPDRTTSKLGLRACMYVLNSGDTSTKRLRVSPGKPSNVRRTVKVSGGATHNSPPQTTRGVCLVFLLRQLSIASRTLRFALRRRDSLANASCLS